MPPPRKLIQSICLTFVLTTCMLQTGCYYMRITRDKAICVLRRSPVSIQKKYTACNLFAPYQEPAGFSQTYKDHLYLNDPYVQPWEVTQVGYEQPIQVPSSPTEHTPLPVAPEAPFSDSQYQLEAPVPIPHHPVPEQLPNSVPLDPGTTVPPPESQEPVAPPIPENTTQAPSEKQSILGLIAPRF